jgi:hypothetical protein
MYRERQSMDRLYACKHCGILAIKNFRDSECPVCHVAMHVWEISVHQRIDGICFFMKAEAPHTEGTDAS